ncbi:MAG: efflux RND transporter periplasmic adaptor subunit [Myxococcales bacterium]
MSEQAMTQGTDDRLQIPELSRRARALRVALVVGLLAAAAVGYHFASQPEPVVERYRTDAVSRRTIVQRVEATGSLDVRERIEVPAPIAGRLMAVHVQPRDRVEKGQLLASLDERAAALAVQTAKATVQAAAGRVAQARTAVDAAQRTLSRTKSLNGKGLASAQDVASAQAELEQARAALSAARAEQKVASQQVASAELGKSLGQIVAPRAGVVLTVPQRIGAAVSPERGPLFVIGDSLSTMRVDALVSETDIAAVKESQPAEVRVPALPGRSFPAKVERIAIEPTRQRGVVMYPVTLLAKNEGGELLPGMSARVLMEVARAQDVLSVHEAALRFTPAGAPEAEPRSRVFKKGAGLNELLPVRVEAGISDGIHTEVRPTEDGALTADDQVAIGLRDPGAEQDGPSVSLGGSK